MDIKTDFESWKQALIASGNVIQDDDLSEWATQNRGPQFDRYSALVASADGVHTPEVFAALMDSMQARHHYGAYNSTIRMLQRFPEKDFAHNLVTALPALIRRVPRTSAETWISDMLCDAQDDETFTHHFRTAFQQASPEDRDAISTFLLHLNNIGALEWDASDFK